MEYNYVKEGWAKIFSELDEIKVEDLYILEHTKDILKNDNNFLKYLGKSKNRTLMKDDPILYKSIFEHTKQFDDYGSNSNKLSFRMLYLVGKLEINCKTCNRKNHWKLEKGELKVCCGKCSPRFPTKKWFKKNYGDDYILEYNKYFSKIKDLKTNSFEWYTMKYGETKGIELYKKRYEKQLKKLNELKQNRYSKISQELFWLVYEKMNKPDNTYFYELNNEYFIKIPDEIHYMKNIVFVDFKYKNKIIEYNGNYWHNKEDDELRIEILNKLGYDVLIVSSNEFNRNIKPIKIVDKCVDFLKNDK